MMMVMIMVMMMMQMQRAAEEQGRSKMEEFTQGLEAKMQGYRSVILIFFDDNQNSRDLEISPGLGPWEISQLPGILIQIHHSSRQCT